MSTPSTSVTLLCAGGEPVVAGRESALLAVSPVLAVALEEFGAGGEVPLPLPGVGAQAVRDLLERTTTVSSVPVCMDWDRWVDAVLAAHMLGVPDDRWLFYWDHFSDEERMSGRDMKRLLDHAAAGAPELLRNGPMGCLMMSAWRSLECDAEDAAAGVTPELLWRAALDALQRACVPQGSGGLARPSFSEALCKMSAGKLAALGGMPALEYMVDVVVRDPPSHARSTLVSQDLLVACVRAGPQADACTARLASTPSMPLDTRTAYVVVVECKTPGHPIARPLLRKIARWTLLYAGLCSEAAMREDVLPTLEERGLLHPSEDEERLLPERVMRSGMLGRGVGNADWSLLDVDRHAWDAGAVAALLEASQFPADDWRAELESARSHRQRKRSNMRHACSTAHLVPLYEALLGCDKLAEMHDAVRDDLVDVVSNLEPREDDRLAQFVEAAFAERPERRFDVAAMARALRSDRLLHLAVRLAGAENA